MSPHDNDAGSGTIPSFWSRLERLGLDVGAVAIIAIALYVTTGIVLRTFFGAAIPDETVIVGEAMVIATVLPLAYVAAEGSFIAVDVFMSFVTKGGRKDALLILLAALTGLFTVAVILIAAYGSLHDAIVFQNYFFGILSLPEWPGRLAFFIGYVFFAIRLCQLCWTNARNAFRSA